MQAVDRDRFEEVELRLAGARVRARVREGPRPVAFVHGLAGSSSYFADADARKELAGRGLIAFDLPGFGGTPAPEGFGFTMREQAEVVVAAVEALAGLMPGRATLVGHSMGGTVSVLAAERLGARLEALVVAEGVLCYDETLWSEQIARMSDDAWAEAFEELQRRPELFARAGMVRRRKDAGARVAPALLQTTAVAVHASAADLHEVSCDPALYERFLSLACPTAYVFGDYHDNTAFCARLRRDGASVEVVHRAGHLMMLDNPDGFYAIVGSGIGDQGSGIRGRPFRP